MISSVSVAAAPSEEGNVLFSSPQEALAWIDAEVAENIDAEIIRDLLHVAGGDGNHRSDAVAVAGCAHEVEGEPVVAVEGFVAQQHSPYGSVQRTVSQPDDPLLAVLCFSTLFAI